MGWWTDRIVPRLEDCSRHSPEVADYRSRACAGLAGQVVEIGFGSGLNVAHYPAAVAAVTAIEPSDLAWELAADRVAAQPVPVTRGGRDAQRMEAGDESADAVLSTLTLCTIPDPERALAEIARVLRPGGTFHFFEHGRAPEDGVRAWQRRLEPLQRRVFGGCHLTRPIDELVAASGLVVERLETDYLTGPAMSRPWTYGYLGTARKPA